MLDLVGEIQEASCKPNHWDHMVEQLCSRFMQAELSAIFNEDRTNNPQRSTLYGMTPKCAPPLPTDSLSTRSAGKTACPWTQCGPS